MHEIKWVFGLSCTCTHLRHDESRVRVVKVVERVGLVLGRAPDSWHRRNRPMARKFGRLHAKEVSP